MKFEVEIIDGDMNYNLKIQTEMAEHIWKLAYDIYKLEWLYERPYLQNKTEKELEQGGEIYVCFNEFMDCEYRLDKDMYIKKILNYIESVYNVATINWLNKHNQGEQK